MLSGARNTCAFASTVSGNELFPAASTIPENGISGHNSDLRRLISHIPMIYRNQSSYYQLGYCKVNVAMICVSPMDDEGYFNLHFTVATAKPVLDAADIVIVEVNEHLPE